MCYFYAHYNPGWTGVASGPDPEAPTQRLETVEIFGVLSGLWPEQGLLPTREAFIECLVGFDIMQISTSPYLAFTLVSVTLWSGIAVTAAATLFCCGYLGFGFLGILMCQLCFGGMKTSLLAPLFGLGWGSYKVCTVAQPYNSAWYHPMQHSTAPHHWALHSTHYIQPKCWWLMLGKTLIGCIGMVIVTYCLRLSDPFSCCSFPQVCICA